MLSNGKSSPLLTINFEILRKLPLKLAVEYGVPKLIPTVAYPLVTSNKMCQIVNQPKLLLERS